MTNGPYRRAYGLILSPVILLCGGGCFHSWINDWLDPTEMGAFDTTHTTEIRRSISVLEEPSGLALATDPTPQDLEVYGEEYRIAPGDILTVRIFELLVAGAETLVTPIVSEQGSIYVPELGWIQAAGYSARELQATLIDELRKQEILEDASIEVVVAAQRQRVYSVFGLIARAGSYPVPRPDFRLMEALLLAGGLPDVAEVVYVFRPTEEAEPSVPPASDALAVPATTTTWKQDSVEDVPSLQWPIEPEPEERDPYELDYAFLSSYSQPVTSGGAREEEPGREPPVTETQPDKERQLLDADLLQAIRPPGVPPVETAPGAEEPTEPPIAGTQREEPFEVEPEEPPPTQPMPLSRWIWLNGKWIEVTPGQEPGIPRTAPGAERPPAVARTEPAVPEEPVSWEEMEVPPSNRIIAVPADLLREGDARYNIVVRDGDTIRVAAGDTGQYYIMGHIYRPGVYSLVGLRVTLKQAIASAGGLDPLAWPDRCDVVRRIGADRETVIPVNLDRIFAGQDADFFLKPHDIINVGTHAVAPFLASIRTAFRITYGFGFVWDRNFADIESQGGSPNPRLARAARQQQFLPGLFP
ncbi:MAG: polysaccharide biosynthesis/export family protein [Phycisphaerales bacterium]|nr:MAG: polysaccharide biosynthesis/export family protein [Phycisphaerales bacterium]